MCNEDILSSSNGSIQEKYSEEHICPCRTPDSYVKLRNFSSKNYKTVI